MDITPTPLSADNPRIADLRRLTGRRRSRVESGRFVIEGPVVLVELLGAGVPVVELFVDVDDWDRSEVDAPLREAVRSAMAASVPVWGLRPGLVASIADTESPRGLLAVAPRRPATIESMATGDGPVLVLVDVADPGNVGTSVRTAAAAGATGVVVAGASADPFGPKAVRASAGSIGRVPVAEADTALEALQALRVVGRHAVATIATGGAPPESVDLTAPVAIVVGSEAHGLPIEVIERCESTVTIPLSASVESVNAAIAGAVVLFEAARQRRMR